MKKKLIKRQFLELTYQISDQNKKLQQFQICTFCVFHSSKFYELEAQHNL